MNNPKMLQYYVVYDWMKSELGLDITERNIFAYVLAWNLQEMTYYASKATTAAFFGISERTVATVFDKLTKANLLISKAEKMPQGNRRIHYVISQEVAAKFAVGQMQKLQLVYAKFAVAQLQNLQKIDNNITDEYPEGYSKKNKDKDVPAEAGTKATADAPAVPVPVSNTQAQEVEIVEVIEPTLFDEGEGILPGLLPKDPKPTKKEKNSAKKEKSAEPVVDFFDRMMHTFDGLPEKLAREFVALRPKTAKNTERAWNDVVIGARKAQAMGYTPCQFFHFMVYHGWYGCNAGYVFDRLQKAQPEELQDMSVEEAVAQFQQSRPAAGPVPLQPVGGYSRPAPASPAQAETRYERTKRRDAEGDEMIDRMFNN